jgi:hypothetical protein
MGKNIWGQASDDFGKATQLRRTSVAVLEAAAAPTVEKPARGAAPAAVNGARKPMSTSTKKKLAAAAKARWTAKKAAAEKTA